MFLKIIFFQKKKFLNHIVKQGLSVFFPLSMVMLALVFEKLKILGKLRFQAINIKIIVYSNPRFANFKFTMLTPKIF